MVPLTMLWLPILVSAVIVFIAATIAWMVLPHHRSDYRQIPDEDRVLDALQASSIGGGQYSFPYVRDFRNIPPETKAKIERGPSGVLIVRRSSSMAMGPQMAQYFLWLLGVSLFVAYITGRALPRTADYLDVFRMAGTTAILGYAAAVIPRSIWYSQPWSVTVKEVLDAVVFGLLTAGVFGWLWPRGIDI